jgi:transposase-like protein
VTTAQKLPRGRPRLLSHGAIHEAIQISDSVAEAAAMLGVAPGYIYAWWVRLGRPGSSPAQRIKDRLADKDSEMRRWRALLGDEATR